MVILDRVHRPDHFDRGSERGIEIARGLSLAHLAENRIAHQARIARLVAIDLPRRQNNALLRLPASREDLTGAWRISMQVGDAKPFRRLNGG